MTGVDPVAPIGRGLPGSRVLVAGGGTAGASAARYLHGIGAEVTVLDDRLALLDPAVARSGIGHELGVEVVSASRLTENPGWIETLDLLVASPGFRPDNPVLAAAAAAGIPVWGEVELAWRLDAAGVFGPPRSWLVITGTNGKTTTTSMTAAILDVSGASAVACGNIGLPVLDALQLDPRVDVLAVEMSSFQLHWAPSVVPAAGVVLNVAEDHLDWHGSFAAYAAAKSGALRGPVSVIGIDDPGAASLAPRVAGRSVGITLDAPIAGQLGVVDGTLVDAAFGPEPRPLIDADEVRPPGPPGRLDALAAAALTLAVGITPEAVRDGLAGFSPGAHRGQSVAEIDGVHFLDDSKATNPHAAAASILAHPRVVLVAGGQLKGASVDDLIAAVRDRLAAVVLLGVDRELIVEAIERHAPDVPTVTVFTRDDGRVEATSRVGDVPSIDLSAHDLPDDGVFGQGDRRDTAASVMDRAVRIAWRFSRADSGATPVLLAPAAASLDMFAGYGTRGDDFAAAARRLGGDAR
ncbi:UDP-N-acetylmuramoyl-L-alanine--D-glutamate ligase [Williamsia sterculiae]|uniref:UDP-N-acetylmuramoylalanine--D-glutamate ligase n=1 Tax=Williamsia sterculiae TaxID=1344003 RepID=A0A1N7H6S4_9NOCA|nr:UDP-N-acetylmuramoyl-L-alanine--D-glutamate ligase [Williamsia sterculiae]SIS20577.1 UDP-N-acetylmuramoylalanine--D-glutamate ligase [Williamsia sterculiae]